MKPATGLPAYEQQRNKQHHSFVPDGNGKLKILFVIDTLEQGGAEQSLLDNLRCFTKIEPVVCHLYAGEFLKPRFLEAGIKVYSVGITARYGFIKAYKALQGIVDKEWPDLMVAYLTRSELVARMVAKFNRILVVGTFVSDLYGSQFNQSLSLKGKLGVRCFEMLNRLTRKYCTAFIANSEAVKQANAKRLDIPARKIEVINRGRDGKLFAFQLHQIDEPDSLRIVNTGRLVPVKNQQMLLRAFKLFSEQQPGASLHIAGEGPERKVLTDLIKATGMEGKVRLLGRRDDLPVLLHQYECFVFPSLSEGFSGAVIEAMMTGLPVLASDIPANKEIITHLKTGYLFDPYSELSLVQALNWVAGNRYEAVRMAARGADWARQHFELRRIAEKMENYLCKLMSGKA
ncbi:glycosyltransferase [Pseudoflavitalea rhizosphaerae]|uniref:glycosyltransferase n=1 Tax=Pseudoflavitalea rhizosphaerae TaxID=1884793 RepID=UPI000F8F652C|nr:glycosyltransferase [Pseudoflavitalea rhizosphaerae]